MTEQQKQHQNKTRIKCTLCDFFLSELVTTEEDLRLHDELWHQMGHIKYMEFFEWDELIKAWNIYNAEVYLRSDDY